MTKFITVLIYFFLFFNVIKSSSNTDKNCFYTLKKQLNINECTICQKENCLNTFESCISGDEENITVFLDRNPSDGFDDLTCFKKVKEITIKSLNFPKYLIEFNGTSISLIDCNFDSLNSINPNIHLTHLSITNLKTQENGSINTTLINTFLKRYQTISYFSSTFNNITGDFSELENLKYKSFEINNNQLEGTIDSSWCNTLLKINNNKLSGKLPSCFTCHIYSDYVKSMIITGNNFSNENPIAVCETLKSNLFYNSTSHELYLYGEDLGFKSEDIENDKYTFKLEKPSKLFIANNVNESDLPKYLKITFSGAKKEFSLSTTKIEPIVSSITISEKLDSITFIGTNLNDPPPISILVDGKNCSFKNFTFYKVQCQIERLSYDDDFTIVKIINGDDFYNFSTTLYTYINQSIQVEYCSKVCKKLDDGICIKIKEYCGGGNIISNSCTSSTAGGCNCSNDFQNSFCSYIPCPIDCNSKSNQGMCNYQTGKCECLRYYQGLDCSILNITCKTNCSFDSNQGKCNTQIGNCECSSNFQGKNCELPFKNCSSDCSAPSQGSCNNQTGICQCFSNYQGSDCSLPLKDCLLDCSFDLKQGLCNNQTGTCQCMPNYQGSNCKIPSHYITSVIPCSIDGGEVLINGWFGNNNDGTHLLSSYNIFIGNLDCIVTSINETEIKCNLGAGIGTKNINIINSKNPNVIFNGNGLFNYQNPIKTCPNSCTSLNNGRCNSNTGECQCNDNFRGFDCSTPIKIIESALSTNTSINKDTGGIELTNQDTIYEISIISLNEISIDGSIIKSHQLKGNWSNDNSTITPDTNYFKFSQQLINNTCKITFTIEEIKLRDKNFTFGTTTFKVEKDSIKLSVLIQDYQYQSSLNTLQLIFYSAVGNDTNSNNNNDCNKQDTSIDTSNANNQQNSNYIQISKNSKTLVGRFINQVIADSRSTFMSSTIIKDNDNNNKSSSSSSVMLGLNLPHCKECLIDPDFSVLVSPDFKESCNERTNKNKWFIPVVVVAPVVGFAAILTLSIVLYRKNKYNIKIASEKLKSLKRK
ncbi:hypothetical protein ACTFIR_003227 [Dictyostelium discoideum]